MKQKTEDYKLSAVRYYINNDYGYDKTCKIFDCKKSSLKRWVQQYKTRKSLIRKPKKAISYKIKKNEVKTALNFLDKTEQLTMNELSMLVKEKHKYFDISPQHLGRIMRNHNRTRKEPDTNIFQVSDETFLPIKNKN
jgi:transposase-like protein